MKTTVEDIIKASGIKRGLKAETLEGLILQGVALLLDDEDVPNLYQDIVDFHVKFELHPPPLYMGDLPFDIKEFREKTLHEELKEFELAVTREDKLDALVDLVYFAIGTAYLYGFDFNKAWSKVHAKNMEKIRAKKKSDSKRKSTFDVVKPAGWTPADLKDCV